MTKYEIITTKTQQRLVIHNIDNMVMQIEHSVSRGVIYYKSNGNLFHSTGPAYLNDRNQHAFSFN